MAKVTDAKNSRGQRKNNLLSKDFSEGQKVNSSSYTSKGYTKKRAYQSTSQTSLKYKEKGCKSFQNPPEKVDPKKIACAKSGSSSSRTKMIAKDKIRRAGSTVKSVTHL